MSAERRFIRHIIVSPDNCWLWDASTKEKGYANFQFEQRRVAGHRWAYKTFRGEIPEGLTLDHLCRIPSCVNPWHLEPVTRWENVYRGTSPFALKAKQTHCVHGHEFTYANTKVTEKGHRRCRTCSGLRLLPEIQEEAS
jgi:hypothetical protein